MWGEGEDLYVHAWSKASEAILESGAITDNGEPPVYVKLFPRIIAIVIVVASLSLQKCILKINWKLSHFHSISPLYLFL